MAIYVKLQFHHLGCLVADPIPRYINGQTWPVVLQADIDELHIIQFHDWAKDMGYLTVDKYACKVNQKGAFRFLKYDVDVLALCQDLKDGDFIDVYICHIINTPCVDVELDEMVSSGGLNVDPTDVQPPVNEMPHGQPTDFNARATHSPNIDINRGDNNNGKGKKRAAVSSSTETSSATEDFSEDEDDFYNFHIATDSEGDVEGDVQGDELSSESDKEYEVNFEDDDDDDTDESLYGYDEDIAGETSDLEPEVVASRQAKVNAKSSKLRSSEVNNDEIPSGPVGIDPGFEDMYKDKSAKYAGKLGGDEQYLDSSHPGSEDTSEEEDGVHNPQPRRHSSRVYFDPACKKICFQLEMVFENVKQFRSALQDYAVQRRVQIKLRPNEQNRVRAKYLNSIRCRWHILGSVEGHTGNFIVKSYHPVHNYFRATRNKMANTAWVAKHYKDKIINQPDIKLKKLQDLIRIKYGVYVGKSICARAKHQVMGQYLGDYKKEFARIYDYADQLRSTNLGSTIIVKTSKETIPGKEVFVGIYVCLHACKVGMQKGLVASVSELLPNAEHRMCARHIWSNWKQKWKGDERRKKFWACARASFEAYLKAKLDELAELGDSKIVEDLLKYPKQAWCRAFFKDWSKCDAVENNMCETFNSWILSARHKSIITMLEEIRVKVMERMTGMREFATRWISDVSPMAMGYIEEQSQYAVKHEYKWNGDTGYEIQHGVYKHIVDFSNCTCTCRSWQLKGLPCSHAICAMFFKKYEPADYVSHWYKKETYLKAFSSYIQPLTNMEMWPSTENPTVDPPMITKMPGRPKKNRKKAADEPKKKFGKRSRKGTPMTCSICKTLGHNKKGCPILRGQASGAAGTSHSGATQPSQAAETTGPQSGPTSDSATARATNTQPSVVASASDTGSMRSRTYEDIIASVRGRPRTTGFGILFGDSGTVIERCGGRDRVHSAPSKVVDDGQTNIDLGYSAPGLRWQGRNAITQRQLRQQLRRKQTEASLSQHHVPSSQPSQTPSHQTLNQSQP